MLYLAGKDNDLLDNSSSLVLEELLNDVATNGSCPSDGEVRVARHELIQSTLCAFQSTDVQFRPPLFIPWKSDY